MREKKEIEQEIRSIGQEIHNMEMSLFYLEMKDTWDHADYDEADHIREKIKKLKEEIDAKREALRK